jgi:glycosyltransferase involved in cell wall biosynthesis
MSDAVREDEIRWRPLSLSVVVPVYNEEDNVGSLVERIVDSVRPLGLPFELVIVDDGSSDGTLAVLQERVARTPELVVVALRRNFGQTLALQAGLDRARGDAIVTMDGDLQNDPVDIPRLLRELEKGADVVSGWRKSRQDTLILRKIPSWIANRLIRLVTRIPIHDQGCSLKAYRADVVRGLDLYGDMHRFIAILTMPIGASITEVEVQHHPRMAGKSKYGLSRTFKVLADLFTIQMITWFRESPMRWFALLGSPFVALAIFAAAAALLSGTHHVILASVALLTSTTFLACLLLGLVGELLLAGEPHGRRVGLVARERGRSL